ncbi:MAG TPA: DUF2723 domain-containing protein [Bacteroidales bacterium]|nr:DUF2723 domain-containing protein [Bacteroidales bacterium]
MKNNFKLINNITGLLIFVIATTVYIITSEPTVSFWDCGEYISTAYKLQVGHPPGAPLFQMLGRIFSLFANGNVSLVARMINTMSAIASGLTILFLFWTITMLGEKIIKIKGEELNKVNTIIVIGSSIIGSLVYTFSDSFWFSAVEGEVYAMSSFFTAITFWSILKWEKIADQNYNYKWLIFIAFLIGLSIGVHLLNLLAIPAIAMIFYFKKCKKASYKGVIGTIILSFLLLAFIMDGIIPEVLNLLAHTEIIFVNKFGLPFNSGTLFFALLIIIILITGIRFTHHPNKFNLIIFITLSFLLILLILSAASSITNLFIRIFTTISIIYVIWLLRNNKPALNTILLSIAFLLIGYSSFLMLVVRANTGTPINEGNPSNAISLLSYLNREQYGDWPLLYGPYYNAPLNPEKPYLDGKPIYEKDEKTKKYIIIDKQEKSIPNYAPEYCTYFPRMWSQQENHIKEYKIWAGIKNDPNNKKIPTFGQNLRYLFLYQLGHMYFRYFMWNFSGKQNDAQGQGGLLEGNWISCIKWIDEIRLGPQKNLPEPMANNKGYNKFYMIPLLLGILGLFFHLNNNVRDAIVIGLLFFMTGIAIILYLNQYPLQPRERDYSYVASFYAFSIWIGLSVFSINDLLKKKIKPIFSSIIAIIICLAAPAIMASQGWDDHNRAGRYTALEIAKNYLEPCEPNSILFTLGDNDTFPLWYAQEVEGIRTDVRVVNISLLSMDWYIDQIQKKVYNSPPIKISIPKNAYIRSKRDIIWFYNNPIFSKTNQYANLADMINFVISEDQDKKLKTTTGKLINYFPTSYFYLTVNKNSLIKNNVIPQNFINNIVDTMKWEVPNYAITKGHLIMLDIIAKNNWERPIYFSATPEPEEYVGLDKYMFLEGLTYRLLPVQNIVNKDENIQVNTDKLYTNLMEKFHWKSFANPKVYIDETNLRNTYLFKNIFYQLSTSLINENKKDSAVKVIDKCFEIMPKSKVPFDYYTLLLYENYYYAGANEKANKLGLELLDYFDDYLKYYYTFSGYKAYLIEDEIKNNLTYIKRIEAIAKNFKDEELVKKATLIFKSYIR